MSQCPGKPLPRSPGAPVSRCPGVPVPWCPGAPVPRRIAASGLASCVTRGGGGWPVAIPPARLGRPRHPPDSAVSQAYRCVRACVMRHKGRGGGRSQGRPRDSGAPGTPQTQPYRRRIAASGLASCVTRGVADLKVLGARPGLRCSHLPACPVNPKLGVDCGKMSQFATDCQTAARWDFVRFCPRERAPGGWFWGHRDIGTRGTWTPGHRDTGAPGVPGHRGTGALGHRDTRTPGHQGTGTPGHRDSGTPGHRDTGGYTGVPVSR